MLQEDKEQNVSLVSILNTIYYKYHELISCKIKLKSLVYMNIEKYNGRCELSIRITQII